MSDSEHPLAPAEDRPEGRGGRSGDGFAAPDCQIDGCERQGEVSRSFRTHDSDEPTVPHYVCRYHHRVLVGVRLLVAVLVIAVFLVAVYQL